MHMRNPSPKTPHRPRDWGCLVLLVLGLLSFTRPAIAGPEPQKARSILPGINQHFLDPNLDVERWVRIFEGESREIYVQRHRIVEAIGLRPGMAVADIGAGTGLFVERLAEKIGPTGRLYAVDIAPRFVEHIRKRAELQGLKQVKALLGREDSLPLPPHSLDVAFVCNTYHHFEYPQSMLSSIYQALRPAGTLVVVEFERTLGKSREWILNHVRADKATFTKEIEAAGFRLVEEVPIKGLKENYFLRFVRP